MLIVEDDKFYSQALSEVLSDRQLGVTVVHTAEEAIALDANSFQGAILDVSLPNDPSLSGISMAESRAGFQAGLCVARRLLERNPSIRLVLLTSKIVDNEAEEWAHKRSIPYIRKQSRSELLRGLDLAGFGTADSRPLAFIVHGHDDIALRELKDYIQNTLLWKEPVVLREQPSSGKTLIEKFEDFAQRVDFVFVLLTPDDTTHAPSSLTRSRRSRQNVIFELGFFYASLGRATGRVFLLHRGEVELPSDIAGIVWIDISHGILAAGESIRRELAVVPVRA